MYTSVMVGMQKILRLELEIKDILDVALGQKFMLRGRKKIEIMNE